MALGSKKPVAPSVGNMYVDLRVVENPLVENKKKRLTYKMRENTNEVSCREKIESNNLVPTIGDADKEDKS